MSSKLSINRNIFLEKEELIRFQNFLMNDTVNQVMLDNTSSWGIVRTVFEGTSPDFLIEVGTNVGTIKLATTSKAVDLDKLLITQTAFDNLAVPSDGLYYWVKISHKYSALEEGTCSININGEVSGTNTKFSEVLRGQSTEVPVKIKFYKDSGLLNDQIYEVVSLNTGAPDTQLILSGYGFVAESNLRYIVIGSTPIGEILTSSQLEGLYQYDACNIELIEETTLDTAPTTDFVADKQFYLARVVNNAGVIAIQDKRTQFLTFNVEGMSNKLDKSNNLSDVDDVAEARANLGVASAAEIENAFFNNTGWLPMTKGSKISATGFSIKIRRIGKSCIIQGKFTVGGTTLADNDIVASIAYSLLKNSVTDYVYQNNEPVYFASSSEFLASHEANRGFIGIVPQKSAIEDYLKLVVYKGSGDNQNIDFAINLSLFLD